MKRYVCTVVAGFVLALTSTATASAQIGLPLPGQSGTQETNFGSQEVGEQKNDADVTQEQGNENLNVSPAIGIFGDAETTNAQGNGNYAESDVEQKNDVDQSQESTQEQSSTQSGSTTCCSGQSQTGEQATSFGDQSVEEQKNEADVTQKQGNGNVNVSPAIAIFGDAETTNAQGNGNVAKSDVDQENDVDQSQSSTQQQHATQSGGSCCESKKGYGTYEKDCCADGQSQAGEQSASFGDQYVGKQRNDADVTQKQGNGNVNVSPAIAVFGDAETTNKQGNGNYAESDVDQENDVDQSQDSYQRQSLVQSGSGCCGNGQSQAGEQHVYGGDQSVDEQRNDADVSQWQGNGNLNVAPAIAFFGDARTSNYQGNWNVARSDIDQKNDVDQTQSTQQKQYLTHEGGDCCRPTYECRDGCETAEGHGHKPSSGCSSKCERAKESGRCCGSPQSGEQKASFGDQYVGKQENDADVTQKQGNWNESFAPAIAFGGLEKHACPSKCEPARHSGNHSRGGAETANFQGNGNVATSEVDQKNEADQSQAAVQRQSLVDRCTGLIAR